MQVLVIGLKRLIWTLVTQMGWGTQQSTPVVGGFGSAGLNVNNNNIDNNNNGVACCRKFCAKSH